MNTSYQLPALVLASTVALSACTGTGTGETARQSLSGLGEDTAYTFDKVTVPHASALKCLAGKWQQDPLLRRASIAVGEVDDDSDKANFEYGDGFLLPQGNSMSMMARGLLRNANFFVVERDPETLNIMIREQELGRMTARQAGNVINTYPGYVNPGRKIGNTGETVAFDTDGMFPAALVFTGSMSFDPAFVVAGAGVNVFGYGGEVKEFTGKLTLHSGLTNVGSGEVLSTHTERNRTKGTSNGVDILTFELGGFFSAGAGIKVDTPLAYAVEVTIAEGLAHTIAKMTPGGDECLPKNVSDASAEGEILSSNDSERDDDKDKVSGSQFALAREEIISPNDNGQNDIRSQHYKVVAFVRAADEAGNPMSVMATVPEQVAVDAGFDDMHLRAA